MAHPHHASARAVFSARVQRHKNRLVAIPAAVQRELGLDRRANNRIVLIAIRKAGSGRWNHHYLKLTHDNEMAIPTDVTHLRPGDEVEVKIRRVIEDIEAPVPAAGTSAGARVLLELAARPRPGFRRDGAANLDDYLVREIAVPRRKKSRRS